MAEQAQRIDDIRDDTRIREALDLLNSYAKDKRGELQEMLTRKYSNLRSAFTEVGEEATHMFQSGRERVRQAAYAVDDNVRSHPWQYVTGTLVGALLIGFIMGRSRSRE